MFEESANCLFEATDLDPNYTDAHYNLGQAMVRLGKLDEAISHLSLVVRLEPEHARAHGDLGSLLLAKGMTKEAAAYSLKGVKLDPNNAEAHYSLAMILADRKELDQALGHYSKAVQLRPEVDNSPALHFLPAMNYIEARQFRKAFVSAQKAFDLAIIDETATPSGCIYF